MTIQNEEELHMALNQCTFLGHPVCSRNPDAHCAVYPGSGERNEEGK